MQASTNGHLQLPSGTKLKLEEFRRRVWTIKLIEGVLAAIFGLCISYLVVFTLDRFFDTPAAVRALILLGGSVGLAIWLPIVWHRWVWKTQRLEQVARIVSHKFPRLGDQLLGVVELVHSQQEQDRSEALCRAALHQVDKETQKRDFAGAVPNPRHQHWAWAAGVPVALALAALLIVPAAGGNALARWMMPWKNVERYTFAQLNELPADKVVPYGEEFDLSAELSKDTAWSPKTGKARYGKQQKIETELKDGKYGFTIPPQDESKPLRVRVGDDYASINVKPTNRPELTTMMASAKLPDYLQYSAPQEKDVRGGSVSILKGSEVTFSGTATRELDEAKVDGKQQKVNGKNLTTHPVTVAESVTKKFTWRDELNLLAKQPFELNIKATDDEQPSIQVGKMQREQVLLDGEVLSFDTFADDDFGVKRIGLEWAGIEDALRNPNPAQGEKLIIDPQDPEKRRVEAKATFSNATEGIKPQSLLMRMYAVDYKPDAERAYSPTYLVHILTKEEHNIWVTNQMRKWFRSAQQVYETEQQLHETNRDLRALSPQQIDLPENRRKIENQAAAESANARRLTSVTHSGEDLIKEAMKNDQFNVQTLEKWAEMLNALKDIAGQRMPSVADLLKEAANAPAGQPGQGPPGQGQPGQGQPGQGEPGQGQPSQGEANQTGGQPGDGQAAPGPPSDTGDTPPEVGNNRDQRVAPGGGQKQDPSENKQTIPKITDVESGFNELDDSESDDEPPPSKGGGKFGLPVTTVVGGGDPPESDGAAAPPATEKVDEAVKEQEDLLAEFAKVAEELQKILNNLEGSTFVKRLKAASRRQIEIAGDLNGGLLNSFGLDENKLDDRSREKADKFAEREVAQSENVFLIQDDLQAYFNRVQQGKFRGVLQDMRETQVVGKLRDMGDALAMNLNGQSISEAEFWADTLDRWAEQLVGPG